MFESVLSVDTSTLLDHLEGSQLPSGSYLAGGTALAMQIGHRSSNDLDFFSPNRFEEGAWELKLEAELGFKLLQKDVQTLNGTVGNVKFQLLGYPYAMIAPRVGFRKVDLASFEDISGMKLNAIIGRGTKRDYIDVYFLAQKFGFSQLFEFYQKKYGNFEEREVMIKKALVYFEEAEGDEMPNMLVDVSWENVKKWLEQEVRKIAR